MTTQGIFELRKYIVLGSDDEYELPLVLKPDGNTFLKDEICEVPLKVVGATDQQDWIDQAMLAEMEPCLIPPDGANSIVWPHYYRVVAE